MIKVSVINNTTKIADDEVSKVVSALQTQVHRDFYVAWGLDAELAFVPRGKDPDLDTWWLSILDNSGQADALGYHDMTSKGLPLGKVFTDIDAEYGDTWSITASHELLEMLANPLLNLASVVKMGKSGRKTVLYSYEICDPVESEDYSYDIDGIKVSNFVYPAWFNFNLEENSTQFDQVNAAKKPFEILPGGYIWVCKNGFGQSWMPITSEQADSNTNVKRKAASLPGAFMISPNRDEESRKRNRENVAYLKNVRRGGKALNSPPTSAANAAAKAKKRPIIEAGSRQELMSKTIDRLVLSDLSKKK